MKPYLLLTPGPLTTSTTVKEAMMTDWCTWDEDYNLGIVDLSPLPPQRQKITPQSFCKVAALTAWKLYSVQRSLPKINS